MTIILSMKPLKLIFIAISITTLLQAEYISIDVDTNKSKAAIALPYIFSSEASGLTGGVVGIFNGYGQENMTIVATVFGGEALTVQTNLTPNEPPNEDKASTRGAFLAISNYQIPFMKRLFVSFLSSYSYYPNQQLYIHGQNNSNKDEVLATQGFNNWLDISFRYTLPLGENKETVITTYKLKNGIPINRDGYGGGYPFITGSTSLELKPFINKWTADKLTQEPKWRTQGIKALLHHDNTDYIVNPSNGYKFKLQYTQDLGNGESTQSWNALEASYSQFIPLTNFSWSKQSVLALNVWTAYSPSWEQDAYLNDDNIINAHRPPPWEGARLGGWNRMRAYDTNRFSDKAAVYYGAELRVIPKMNPLERASWIPVNIDWFQVVAFAELGRVAPAYNIKKLHTDLKYDVGLSLRALAAKVPVRFDIAYGEEGTSMWVMIQQPF